jgi:hypothetical protein
MKVMDELRSHSGRCGYLNSLKINYIKLNLMWRGLIYVYKQAKEITQLTKLPLLRHYKMLRLKRWKVETSINGAINVAINTITGMNLKVPACLRCNDSIVLCGLVAHPLQFLAAPRNFYPSSSFEMKFSGVSQILYS